MRLLRRPASSSRCTSCSSARRCHRIYRSASPRGQHLPLVRATAASWRRCIPREGRGRWLKRPRPIFRVGAENRLEQRAPPRWCAQGAGHVRVLLRPVRRARLVGSDRCAHRMRTRRHRSHRPVSGVEDSWCRDRAHGRRRARSAHLRPHRAGPGRVRTGLRALRRRARRRGRGPIIPRRPGACAGSHRRGVRAAQPTGRCRASARRNPRADPPRRQRRSGTS